MTSPLLLDVADLRPGHRRAHTVEAGLDGLRVVGTQVPPGELVHLELQLEAISGAVVVTGTASAPWVSECRRCLRPVGRILEAPIHEIFEADPTEGETWLLDGGRIDVEPVVREAVLLSLPLAPLCVDDCAGLCPTCGADRNEADASGAVCACPTERRDLRWAALDELTFDEQ